MLCIFSRCRPTNMYSFWEQKQLCNSWNETTRHLFRNNFRRFPRDSRHAGMLYRLSRVSGDAVEGVGAKPASQTENNHTCAYLRLSDSLLIWAVLIQRSQDKGKNNIPAPCVVGMSNWRLCLSGSDKSHMAVVLYILYRSLGSSWSSLNR